MGSSAHLPGIKHRLLSAAEEKQLAKRIERGDLAAKETLILHNLRLCAQIAHKWALADNATMSVEDLYHEAVTGLVRAAEKFDHRRPNRFTTYATPWIEQACRICSHNHSRAIRQPSYIVLAHRKLRIAAAKLEADDIYCDEVLAAADVSRKVADYVQRSAFVAASLDQELAGSDSDGTLADILPGPEVKFIPDESFDQMIAPLNGAQRELLRMRFEQGLSRSAIAVRLGRSVKWVDNAVDVALEQLRAEQPAERTQSERSRRAYARPGGKPCPHCEKSVRGANWERHMRCHHPDSDEGRTAQAAEDARVAVYGPRTRRPRKASKASSAETAAD